MADSTEQSKPNPFMGYLQSLPGRLVQLPIRAAQLPFQVAQEIFQTPAVQRAREIEGLQRDLNMQVTGQEPAYSEGRRIASGLSLGLIPGNQAPNVNPTELNPEQQQRFGQLTPLQQRLLMSKRPQDFADMLGDESLWQQPAPETAIVPTNSSLVNKQTGEVLYGAAPPKPQIVPPESSLMDAEGNVLGTAPAKAPAPREEFSQFDPTNYTPKSIAKFRKSKDVGDLVVDTTKLRMQLDADQKKAETAANAKPDPNAPKPTSLLDVNRVQGPYLQQAKPYIEMADRFRGFMGTYASDPLKMPDDIRGDLISMKIDPAKVQPGAIHDLSTVVAFLKTIDPPSIAREGEQAAVAAARHLRMPLETMQMLFSGQTLTNDQRTEIYRAMRGAFLSRLGGYENMRNAHLAISKQYLPNDDPNLIVYDVMGDLRGFLNQGQQGGPNTQGAPGAGIDQNLLDAGTSAAQQGGEVANANQAAFDRAWKDYSAQAGDKANEKDFKAYLKKLGLLRPED